MFSFDPGQRIIQPGGMLVAKTGPAAAVPRLAVDDDLGKLRGVVGCDSLNSEVGDPIRLPGPGTDGLCAAVPLVQRRRGLVDQIGLDNQVVVHADIPRLVDARLITSSQGSGY